MDSLSYTADNIEMGVKKFYEYAGQPITELNQWLMFAQCSPEAWEYPWALLSLEKPLEVQFFGIGSLHMKISRYWQELPGDRILPLRDQLFNLLYKYLNGPKIVTTRVCITMTSFLIHATPTHWLNPISNLIEFFNSQNNTSAQLILLEILTVLPEEFSSMFLLPDRRNIFRRELQNNASIVLQLIHSFLEKINSTCDASINESIQQQAMHCFSSWTLFVSLEEAEKVAALIFQLVANCSENFDVAIDSLIHLFQNPDNHKYPKTIFKLLCYVVQLENIFNKEVSENNMEECQSLTKLFVIAAENNIQNILNYLVGTPEENQLGYSLIQIILSTVAVPGFFPVDECCSDMSFGFWYNFQDDLMGFSKVTEIIPNLINIFSHLVDIFIRKVQYPSDVDFNSWNSDEKESHRCYRQDISDSISYLFNVLHDSIMITLTNRLDKLITLSSTESVPWQEFEGVIYLLTALMEGTNMEESSCLPLIFERLPRLPSENSLLVAQNMYFIASCAEFLSDNPVLLNQMIPFLLNGLSEQKLAVASSLALKDLLYENRNLPSELVQQILMAIKRAIDSGNLQSSEFLRLICCVGFLLSLLPFDEFVQYSNGILGPHVVTLQYLTTNCDINSSEKLLLQEKLKMLSNFFLSLTDNQNKENNPSVLEIKENADIKPAYFLFENILPILNNVFTNFSLDPLLINDVCDVIRRALVTLNNDCMPLLPRIIHMILTLFEKYSHPCILTLSKQIIILCCNEPTIQPMLQNLFSSLTKLSLTSVNNACFEQIDLIEELITFLAQISKKNVKLLCDSTVNLVEIFKTALKGICRHESTISKASCIFMVTIISSSSENISIKDVITNHGAFLVEIILKGIAGDIPRNNVPPLVDVLFALSKDQSDFFCRCMNEFVNLDGFPNSRVTRTEKEEFAKKVIYERKNKRALKEFVNEYSLLWRGLINTEYAAQTSQLHSYLN